MESQASSPPPGKGGSLDSWRTITALLWLGLVAIATYQLIPLVTGSLVDDYGFHDAAAGYVSSCYWAAGLLASICALYWLPRWDRRRVLFAMLCIGLLAELSSVFLHGYAALAVGRVVTGFAGASVTCIVLAALTNSAHSQRLYGLYTASLSLFAALGFLVIPAVLPALHHALGVGALFAIFAVFWATGLIAATLVPGGTGGSAVAASGDVKPPRLFTPAVAALFLSLLVFYVGNGGLWTFIDRIGVWTGVDSGSITLVLSIGNVFAILGGVAASLIGLRFKVVAPVVAGTVLVIVGNLALLASAGIAGYAVGNFFSYAFVIFTVSAYLQSYGVVDKSGRLMAAGSLASFGGAALGPIILSLFIPSGSAPSYSGFLIADTVVFAIAPVLFVVSWWGLRRSRMVDDNALSAVEVGQSA